MKCIPIKTRRVDAGQITLQKLIDESIDSFEDGSILAITSKIVSLCEDNVVDAESTDKEKLIASESQYYLPSELSKYGHHFTITNNTLIAGAGIDASNGDGHYVLWPKDAQKTANEIRRYVMSKYDLKSFGIIITDSTSQPMRLGTTGIALVHSGFVALNNYIGESDLYGRPLGVTQSNIAGGLAAAAVVTMGEGAECQPLCMLSGLDFVEFQPREPSEDELEAMKVRLEDDLFGPFLSSVKWIRGQKQ